ncbi:MAG: AI-2E family transporter [Patescibacteria group bacterium]|jgi:predicted PurR-regulated permease PerM
MSLNQTPVQVNISSLTIIKIILVVLGLFFLWSIQEVIAMVFVAWILVFALEPLVSRMQRWHIPRAVSILLIYAVFLGIITAMVILLIPPLSAELASITNNFPQYMESLKANIDSIKQASADIGIFATIQTAADQAVNSVSSMTNGIYNALATVVNSIVALVGILVITFYMLVEEEGIKKFLQSILPVNYQPYVIHKITQIQTRLSAWLWGELVLMLFVGTMVGVALQLAGVKYALVLGLLAGLTEVIPIVGPIIAAVPAVFFSLVDVTAAPYKPLLIIAIYILVQQIENHLLVPKVMNKAVGVNPIVVLISLLIAAKLGGLVGIILAVPTVTIISIFLEDFLNQRKIEQNKLEE